MPIDDYFPWSASGYRSPLRIAVEEFTIPDVTLPECRRYHAVIFSGDTKVVDMREMPADDIRGEADRLARTLSERGYKLSKDLSNIKTS